MSFDDRKEYSELLPIPDLETLVDSHLRNWGFCHWCYNKFFPIYYLLYIIKLYFR